jgi:hypothetical protein
VRLTKHTIPEGATFVVGQTKSKVIKKIKFCLCIFCLDTRR